MDPNQAWTDLIGSDDVDDIREYAQNLDTWIRRGGFRPRAVNSRGETLPVGFALTVGGITFRKLADGTISAEHNC